MRKKIIFISILTIFCQLSLFAQKELRLEKKAFKYYNSGDKVEALNIFKELFVKFPNSNNYPITFFNIANCYSEIDSTDLAIKWYKDILKSNIKDNQEFYNFPDTHTNIKHKSAIRTGNIYYNQGEIEQALKYYLLALNEYSYYSSSGTSKKKNDIRLKNYIVDCYKKTNRIDAAVILLLPDALTKSPWNNNLVAEYLFKIIDENYEKNKFSNELMGALKNIDQKKDHYLMSFWGEKIKIEPYDVFLEKEVFVKQVEESEFIKKLNEE
ncbi:MAG: hypothetical protein L3J23_05900 [Flavobacteriaceae bacterium]|nr:hypothetical protein [Flavobacteriaceae bacterium]